MTVKTANGETAQELRGVPHTWIVHTPAQARLRCDTYRAIQTDGTHISLIDLNVLRDDRWWYEGVANRTDPSDYADGEKYLAGWYVEAGGYDSGPYADVRAALTALRTEVRDRNTRS